MDIVVISVLRSVIALFCFNVIHVCDNVFANSFAETGDDKVI